LKLISGFRKIRDFHTHSDKSDGVFSPSEVVGKASEAGIKQLALTDHNTIRGLSEAQSAARASGIDSINGIEVSAKFKGETVHVLGYGFDLTTAQEDEDFIDYLIFLRRASGINLFESAESEAEQFTNLEKVIKILIKIGAVPVLAHPGEEFINEKDIAEMVKMGLKGIEVYTKKHSAEQVIEYERIARKYKLFMTTGSDFHGYYDDDLHRLGRDNNGKNLTKAYL